ncbi:MAG TPA: hypothetical protein VK737_07130 [Opitutales bacterium]|jgi:hypothetical protein|nr:hypothetical protein [Opitutales bacterium]
MRTLLQWRAWALAMLAMLAACTTPRSATSGPPGVSTEGVAITHVDHRFMVEDDFKRISEYFTGVENTSGRVIERTDPKNRTGYYFIVALEWHPHTTLPTGTRAELDYVREDTPDVHHAQFTFSQDAGTWHEILLGLTGADWPDKNTKLVAWKVTLKDATGSVLASYQSFLWGLPANGTEAAVTTASTEPATAHP